MSSEYLGLFRGFNIFILKGVLYGIKIRDPKREFARVNDQDI